LGLRGFAAALWRAQRILDHDWRFHPLSTDSAMLETLVRFLAAAAIIIAAGIVLTRCADAIAELTGFGRLLIGSILLAGATSLPELSVDLSAVRLGAYDLAVGDLVGSSLFNLLILAILDLTHRKRGHMFSRAAAGHALSGTMSITLTATVGICILLGPQFAPYRLGPVGVGTLLVVAAYLFGMRLVYMDQRYAATLAKSEGVEPVPHAGKLTLRRAVAGFLAAAVVIVVTGPFMARAADRLAELSGLGRTFVGTIMVAFSTSLPELVATATAVRMGAFDLAVANIFGSNAFNMVLIFPLDLASGTPILLSVSQTHVITCIWTILVTGVVVMGQLYHVENRRRIVEPDALLVIGLVTAWIWLVYSLR
jgi:cation:H+ antiporter